MNKPLDSRGDGLDCDSARELAGALGQISDCLFMVWIWEDRFQVLQAEDTIRAAVSEYDSYSAMMFEFIGQFIDAGFQEDAYYHLSAECICSRLNSENEYYYADYPVVTDRGPGCFRVHVMLLEAGAEGLAGRVLLMLQDITTHTKEEDLNDLAFSLMRSGYCRIAFLDLNRDTMMTLQAVSGEPVDKRKNYRYTETLQEIVQQTVLPEYQEKLLSILEPNHLRGMFDRGVPSVEFSYQRQLNGGISWVRAEVVALQDYTPENACAMWYVRDLSAEEVRKDAYLETVLQDNVVLNAALSSEKQYRLALMADSFFYYTFDVSGDGLIKDEFLSRDGTDIIGAATGMNLPVPFETFCQKWYELYQPVFDKKTEEDIFTLSYLRSAFLRNERVIEIEVKQTPPADSGAMEFMEMMIVLSEDEMSGHIMACVIWKDISEFRKMELQARIALKEAYEVAEQASRAKSEFLSRMSHDIRTPMNAIIGMTAIAQNHLHDPERVQDCLQKINVSSKHLLSLVNEVLDMSKIESGKVDLNEEPFLLSELIDNLTLMVRPQMVAKRHNFNIQINNVEHERVIGDCLRIQQSFVNLMGNAVKYTPDGGRIDLIITEKPCRQHQFASYEFVFQDNGIGMSPEFVDRIFEPFSRAEDTRVNKIQGTGLGMAIANNLVHMMNGNIKVQSELGKGSRITVSIFLRLQDAAEEELYQKFHGLSALVADSDQATCETACGILSEMGIESEWVLSGREAVQRVAERQQKGDSYFAVIVDWQLSKEGDVSLLGEFRRQVGHNAPVVVVSAYDLSDIELNARAAGAEAFISKPLFKSRFAELFHELLNGERQRSATEEPLQDLSDEVFQGQRILLAEDNDLNAEIATEILAMAGLSVERAEDGKKALEMFQTSQPGYYALIFMDIQMPIMNGYEATQAIRALSREDAASIPIVAMTANAFTEDVQMALQAGMNEHIAKPLDFDQLMRTLRRWLHVS